MALTDQQLARLKAVIDTLIAAGLVEIVTCVQNSANDWAWAWSEGTLAKLEREAGAIAAAGIRVEHPLFG